MPRDSPTMRLTSSGDGGRTTIIPQSCSLGKRYFAPASGLGMEELVLLGVQTQRGNGRGLPRLVEVRPTCTTRDRTSTSSPTWIGSLNRILSMESVVA